MRIVQLMLGKGFGGAERSFVDITNVLSKQGHELLVIVNSRGICWPKIDKRPNVSLVSISCLGVWDRLAGLTIYRHLKRFSPQIVHAHLARASAIGGKSARKLGIATVAKTHNLINPKYYRFIDRIVSTTNAQQRHLLDNGVQKNRLCLIPNFSTAPSVSEAELRERQQRQGQRKFVLRGAGRLVYKKGFDVMLEAIFILKALNLWLHVEIAGDGPEKPELLALTRKLGLEREVSFLGWKENIVDFIKGADLFLLPSREEPFGVVLLEAMAAGTPIIATRTQGPEEIFQNGGGITCGVDNPGELAKAIRRALSSPVRWEMALDARQIYRDKYSSEVVVEQYEGLYKELLRHDPR